MENWVSTICQKAWHRIKHPLRNDVNLKHERQIKGHVSALNDAKRPPEKDRHFNAPSSLPLKGSNLSDESEFAQSADCARRIKECESSDRRGYLVERENCDQDIDKLNSILTMPQVLMEVGCGNAEAARQIALRNPNIGVVATDLYDWSDLQCSSSDMGKLRVSGARGNYAPKSIRLLISSFSGRKQIY